MKIFVTVWIALAAGFGCTSGSLPRPEGQAAAAEPPPSPPAPGPSAKNRTPAVPKDSPHYDLFEGTSRNNACAKDDECHVGGCSHEVCTAETRVMTPCIFHDDAPKGATCGCVTGQCIWYR